MCGRIVYCLSGGAPVGSGDVSGLWLRCEVGRGKVEREEDKMILQPHIGLPIISHRLPPSPSTLSFRCSYSVSDDQLNSRGFTLRRSASGLDLNHLNTVFAAVGFPRRDPEKIRVALEHTDSVVWVEDQRSGKPVAFARATGDGVFNAIVWDVVVDPSLQGVGLGKAVMERLVGELVERGITNIGLYSEARVQGFYRPLGFVADPGGIRGMVYSTQTQTQTPR